MHHHPDHSSQGILDALTFTVEALSARDDARLKGLAGRLAPLLEDGAAIESDGRALRRAVIASTARAAVADSALDVGIAAFAKELLGPGSSFADFTDRYPEALFLDHCHLTSAGNEAFARDLVALLEPS